MPLIGNDFTLMTSTVRRRCSECGAGIPAGSDMLASVKYGKVRKVVCSENCRLEFDARVWQEFAERNQRNRR
jgi:hypothetical protein